VHDDLDELGLFGVGIGLFDGEGDKMISVVSLEANRDHALGSVVASLVQRKAISGGGIRGFILVVRVFDGANKRVLSWVKFLLRHACNPAPCYILAGT